MIVEFTGNQYVTMTQHKEYEVESESDGYYRVTNDVGEIEGWAKDSFKIAITPETIHTNQKLKHNNGNIYEVKEIDGVISLVEFVELPKVGEMCLFSNVNHEFKDEFGRVAILSEIKSNSFSSLKYGDYTYCKPIKSINKGE